MPSLEVRSPVPPTRSTSDLVQQVLAHVRSGHPEETPHQTQALQPDALKARAAAGPPSLGELSARTPPGPTAKPPPEPLKGPAAAAPPRAQSVAQSGPHPGASQTQGRPGSSAPAPVAAQPVQPPPFNIAQLIDEDAPWLPPEPERKAAFLTVFRYWHSQVRPENATKATPAFLFLVSALPVMIKARDDLKALNLWEPPGEHSRQARDQHSAWKKYCEFLPRAQQALQELDAFRHLSLLSALDDLNSRVSKAEKRYREGVPVPPKPGGRR